MTHPLTWHTIRVPMRNLEVGDYVLTFRGTVTGPPERYHGVDMTHDLTVSCRRPDGTLIVRTRPSTWMLTIRRTP